MTTDAKFSATSSFRSLIADTGGNEESQYLSRRTLVQTTSNAIEFARISQRIVGLLIVQLVRTDKLEALVGTPTSEIMRHAVRRLPTVLRQVDRLAAVTEDKIIILLPNLKTSAQAWLAAGKIQATLEEGFSVEGEMLTVRPVLGIATFPDHAELAEELIVHADIAVGVAAMRDVALHVFQKDDQRDSDVYLGLEAPLREAIRSNQLMLYFQPQIDLKTGKCSAAEALLRWNAPEYGVVAPDTVVRIAEASGAIGALTIWVLNNTLRQHAEWLKLGTVMNVSVNLSTLNLADNELPDAIKQALGTWNIEPERVTFEVTESATIGDAQQSVAVLNRIKALGVKIAIDDFGTGSSSLSYLKTFPLDEIKIDKMFIQNMRSSEADQKIVRSVIALAHSFNLTVIAEGVEDESTARELKKMHCDGAQGYVYSPALPAAAFVTWLKNHHN